MIKNIEYKISFFLNVILLVSSCSQNNTKSKVRYDIIKDLFKQETYEITQEMTFDSNKQDYIFNYAMLFPYFKNTIDMYHDDTICKFEKFFCMDSLPLIYDKLINENEYIDTTILNGFLMSSNYNNEIEHGKKVIIISLPVVINNFALVEIDYNRLGSSKGITYVLEYKNNKWIIKDKSVRWIE